MRRCETLLASERGRPGVWAQRSNRVTLEGFYFDHGELHARGAFEYSHGMDWHSVYATHQGTTRRSVGWLDGGAAVQRPDHPGAVSFTPANHFRRGRLEQGTLVLTRVFIAPAFAAEAAGTPAASLAWQPLFNEGSQHLSRAAEILARVAANADAVPTVVVESMAVAFARLLATTQGGVPLRADDSRLDPSALRRVLELVEINLACPPGLAAMAQETGLGISAFVRAFRSSLGVTPARYVLRRRLDTAMDFLMHHTLPIADIAAQTGFCSPSHLANTFKSRFGKTPESIRRSSG